jgi:hypothetical protein
VLLDAQEKAYTSLVNDLNKVRSLGMCDELPFGCISHKDQALHASIDPNPKHINMLK